MMMDFSGLEVNVEIGGITYHASLEDDITIDSQDLDNEFLNQARKYAWWAMVSELAKDLVARRKYELDMLYAQLDQKKRATALANKFKMTEKMVENEVITDVSYQEAKRDYLQAKQWYGLLQAGREAFAQRKEMLISLGANYRAEGQADPVLLQEKAKQKAADQARTKAQRKPKATAKQSPEAAQTASGKSPMKRTRQPVQRA
jgi:hypothetical protein